MAHKKGVGSSRNGRDSHSKRLGVKLFGGESAIAGNIIIRQRGTKHHPGKNVGLGKDYTIFALVNGTVKFRPGRNSRSYVDIIPAGPSVIETAAIPVAKNPAAKVAAPAAEPVAETTPASEPVAKATAPAQESTASTIIGTMAAAAGVVAGVAEVAAGAVSDAVKSVTGAEDDETAAK